MPPLVVRAGSWLLALGLLAVGAPTMVAVDGAVLAGVAHPPVLRPATDDRKARV